MRARSKANQLTLLSVREKRNSCSHEQEPKDLFFLLTVGEICHYCTAIVSGDVRPQ